MYALHFSSVEGTNLPLIIFELNIPLMPLYNLTSKTHELHLLIFVLIIC